MIDILLPVYNGAAYLADQIESFFAQSYQDWRLLIRNDGSSDNSQDIINYYITKYPNKVLFIEDPKGNIGLVKSLNILLSHTSGDYIMFSDQDDIWLPEKIELSLREIQRIENDNRPAMVCTDVICVDHNLNTISDSFFKSQKFINGIMGDQEKMLALNEVQGCTIIINRSTLSYICPIPTFMRIHDMWIGVICAHYGMVSYLHKQTVLYRQHNGNTLGSVNVNFRYYLQRIKYFPYLVKSRYKLFSILPFRVNTLKVVWYKIKYTILRII